MNSTVMVALISFCGTLFGTLGGIIASSKLVNYRLEQLEKKVDAQNKAAAHIPIIEEKLKGFERRILNLEMGGIKYENFKINNYKNGYAHNSTGQSNS